MNLDFVQQVGRDNPTWLPTNLGRTCYAHTVELIRRLRAAGHEAWAVCKMEGEGGYAPPGFTPFTVTGFDGKPYPITRVSHDVVFVQFAGSTELRQFDTLGAANEHDRTIYRRDGDPNWSFDPNDGPQIKAVADWREVPRGNWRPWNPPYKGVLPAAPVDGTNPGTPTPTPAPTPIAQGPGREEMMNAGRWLDGFYRSQEGLQREHGLIKFRDGDPTKPEPDYEGLGAWLFDVYWNARLRGKTEGEARSAVIAAIQQTDEWKARHR